jgi:hypothetical protein
MSFIVGKSPGRDGAYILAHRNPFLALYPFEEMPSQPRPPFLRAQNENARGRQVRCQGATQPRICKIKTNRPSPHLPDD